MAYKYPYCSLCENGATHIITETNTPLCYTCQEAYKLGKENQGTIEEI